MSSTRHHPPVVEILSQGDEVVTGQTVDTNAAWLSERFTELGFRVGRHTSVGDRLGDLVALFREIEGRADLCICTGGLGPTDDDLTAQAVAEAFDRPLRLDEVALEQIVERYRSFGREMPEVNKRQALLPAGAERVDNRHGTAPGFAFGGSTWFVCLPGVPREMKAMFGEEVLPRVLSRFAVSPGRLVTFRTVGVGESNLQEAIGLFHEADVVLAYRTILPENHVKLRFQAGVPLDRVLQVCRRLGAAIGRWTFTVEGLEEPEAASLELDRGGGSLAATVGRHLLASGHTLSTAESCTGGLLAAECTGIPGASGWFTEARITYDNEAKVRQLGVERSVLEAHGAVSEPVARQMAEGVRQRAGTTWALAVTGIAGPDGGTPQKPVGTVHIALAGPSGTVHRAVRLPGDRDRVRRLTVATALEMLRRALLPH